MCTAVNVRHCCSPLPKAISHPSQGDFSALFQRFCRSLSQGQVCSLYHLHHPVKFACRRLRLFPSRSRRPTGLLAPSPTGRFAPLTGRSLISQCAYLRALIYVLLSTLHYVLESTLAPASSSPHRRRGSSAARSVLQALHPGTKVNATPFPSTRQIQKQKISTKYF
jgi:hypothetical protein